MPQHIKTDLHLLIVAIVLVLLLLVLEHIGAMRIGRAAARSVLRLSWALVVIWAVFALVDLVPFCMHGTVWSPSARMKMAPFKVGCTLTAVITVVIWYIADIRGMKPCSKLIDSDSIH